MSSLVKKSVDMSSVPVDVILERSIAIDYLPSIDGPRLSIWIKIEDLTSSHIVWTLFLRPFQWELWLAILLTALAITVLTTMFHEIKKLTFNVRHVRKILGYTSERFFI